MEYRRLVSTAIFALAFSLALCLPMSAYAAQGGGANSKQGQGAVLTTQAESPLPWNTDIMCSDISLDDPAVNVTIGEDGDPVYFRFVPPETAEYHFYSSDYEDDPEMTLFDDTGDEINYSDNGFSSGCDFSLVEELQAGKSYYVCAGNCDGEADKYILHVEKAKQVASIDAKLKEGASPLVSGIDSGEVDSYYDKESDKDIEFYRFYPSAILERLDITATYEGGTTSPFFDVDRISLDYNCVTWSIGGDNPVTLRLGESSVTVKMPMGDLESRFPDSLRLSVGETYHVKLEGAPKTLLFTAPEDGSYRFYSSDNGDHDPKAYLRDTDGDTLAEDDDSGENGNFSFTCNLTGGRNYLLEATDCDGNISEYDIHVRELLGIKDMSVSLKTGAPQLTMGNYDQGYWTSSDDDSEYFRFDSSVVRELLSVAAIYSDGTSDDVSDEVEIEFDCSKWKVGTAGNTVTVRMGSFVKTIDVPVASFSQLHADAAKLTLDAPQKVAAGSGSVYFTFTPSKSGSHYFYSRGSADALASLFDERGRMVKNDDDGMGDLNFIIGYDLTAGVTYVLNCGFYAASTEGYEVVVTAAKPESAVGGYESIEGKKLSGKYINLALVVDTTGSMEWAIANVRNNLKEFSKALAETGATLRIALIEYRDIDPKEHGGPETTKIHYAKSGSVWYENADIDALVEEIETLDADGGGDGPESAVDALANLVEPDIMTFNSTAAKFAFLITDADYKNANQHGIADMSALTTMLKDQGIITSTITRKDYYSTYSDLVTRTGGRLMNLAGNFADSMGAFAASIADTTESYAADAAIVPVTDISLSGDLTVPVGKIRAFVPTITPASATNKNVAWDVEDKTIATVKSTTGGMIVVQGKKEGTTKITARSLDGGYVASFDLTVQDCYVDGNKMETCDIEDVIKYAKDSSSSVTDLIYYADADETKTVPEASQREIYSALKGTVKSITYVYDDEIGSLDHSWLIAGKDISNASIAVNLELKASGETDAVAKAVKDSKVSNVSVLDFSHSGDLPGKAKVKAKVDLADGKDYSLFHYQPSTDALELVSDDIEVAGGIGEVEISHCSTYVIAKRSKDVADTTGAAEPSTTTVPVVMTPAVTGVQQPSSTETQASPIVKAKKKTVALKAKKLKKKKKVISNLKVSGLSGKVRFKNVSKNKVAKKFKVNSKGAVTVKKGTKKGKYVVKIKVTAPQVAFKKTVKFTLRVK